MDDSQIIADLQKGGRKGGKALGALDKKYAYLKKQESLPCTTRSADELEAAKREAWQDSLKDFEKQVKKGKKIDGTTSLEPYLRKIYKNKLIDICRRLTSVKRGGRQVDEELSATQHLPAKAESHPQEILRLKALREMMQQALEELGDPCRSILLLDIQGYKNEEIAQRLGFRNKAVVASRKKTCHYQLRDLLEAKGIDPKDYL